MCKLQPNFKVKQSNLKTYYLMLTKKLMHTISVRYLLRPSVINPCSDINLLSEERGQNLSENV